MKDNDDLTKGSEEFLMEVQNMLDGFRKDHQEMTNVLKANATALRNGLADGEKERMNTYNGLMDGIHNTISTIQQEVAAVQTSTFNLLNGFANDRVQMAEELNKFFAQGRSDREQNEKIRMQDEKNRIKDFNALMKAINNDLKGINDEVLSIFKNTNDLLSRFDKEHKEMSAELRAELGKNLTDRVKYTKALLMGFQQRLTEIGNENKQMAKEMRNELAKSQGKIKKGEAERLVDYNTVMNGIKEAIAGIGKEVMEIQKATKGMIGGYSKDRSEAAAEWDKMQEAIAEIKKTGLVKPTVKAEKKVEKKKDLPVEAVEETPVIPTVEAVKETTKADAPAEELKESPAKSPENVVLTLEERIVDYINKHPKGVRISEMEKPLGETRMKLGYLAKNLLDAGKVQKVENVYFPIK
ncbi:MAG: hypothetical protein K9G61_02000 [Bacteroidales bacterium]|nr:hypothetical protein [Bacteroidales bacterium]